MKSKRTEFEDKYAEIWNPFGLYDVRYNIKTRYGSITAVLYINKIYNF